MNTSILAIDPGSRLWGVAVFAGGSFHTSCIKYLSAKDTAASRLPQTRKTFRELCRQYHPNVLVLKYPRKTWFKQSEHLSKVFSELRRLARYEGVKVVELTREEMHEALCGRAGGVTEDLLSLIRRFDRDLGDWLLSEKDKTDRFRWSRLMTSIALGIWYVNAKSSNARGASP
jgi:Holliday junction resolvasome RuvABC endonuclease subunit